MKKVHKILWIVLPVVILGTVVGLFWLRGQSGSTDAVPSFTVLSLYEKQAGVPEGELSVAPDFTVYDLEGNAWKLSDFQGKPVILNFWATWCGPCKEELPELQAAWEEYGNQIHFLIVDLADGKKDTVETASAYLADNGYTFPAYYDTALEAEQAYAINAVPVTYFIDAEGFFVAYQLGSMDQSLLQQGIDLLLND